MAVYWRRRLTSRYVLRKVSRHKHKILKDKSRHAHRTWVIVYYLLSKSYYQFIRCRAICKQLHTFLKVKLTRVTPQDHAWVDHSMHIPFETFLHDIQLFNTAGWVSACVVTISIHLRRSASVGEKKERRMIRASTSRFWWPNIKDCMDLK